MMNWPVWWAGEVWREDEGRSGGLSFLVLL